MSELTLAERKRTGNLSHASRTALRAESGPNPAPIVPRVATILELQRTAGNSAVTSLLQRAPVTTSSTSTPTQPIATPMPALPAATIPPRKNYVFIMGDTKGDSFYTAATAFFKQHEQGAEIVQKRTLKDIIDTVNAGAVPVLKLIIVSHANEQGNLGFALDAADLKRDLNADDKKPRVEYREITAANAAGTLPTADVKLIDQLTKIELKGCNIGRSRLMLDQLDLAFGGHAEVIAPTHRQGYSISAKGVAEDFFDSYSIEDAGKVTEPNASELESRFRAKYPAVPGARWGSMMKAVRKKYIKRVTYTWRGPNPPDDNEQAVVARLNAANRFPESEGWVFNYSPRTVVGESFHYELIAERVNADGSTTSKQVSIDAPIPPEAEALKAQEQANSGRPDAYTWSVEDDVRGTSIKRRVIQERTEWTIAKHIVDAAGTAHPPVTDSTFYGHSVAEPPPPTTP